MIRESDVRYVVAAMQDGIWYTLMADEKLYWAYSQLPKVFKCSGWAIKAANNVNRHYVVQRVCVFKVRLGEEISSDNYKKWANEKDRMVIDYEPCN